MSLFHFTLQVKACPKCQHMLKMKSLAPALQPIKTDGTWDVVGIDLMEPYVDTERGSKYIFTATDLFSKFVFARPIKVLLLFRLLGLVKLFEHFTGYCTYKVNVIIIANNILYFCLAFNKFTCQVLFVWFNIDYCTSMYEHDKLKYRLTHYNFWQWYI